MKTKSKSGLIFWRRRSTSVAALVHSFVLSLFALTSCHDLTEDPKSFLAPENFYKTTADAQAALTAVYNSLGGYPNLLSVVEWTIDDYRIDQVTTADFSGPYVFSAATARFGEIWANHYQGIDAANAVIERVPGANVPPALRDRYVAEANFLRALYYFNLVRLFGGVPMPLTPSASLTGLDLSRSSESAIYAQIIQDLTVAETALPDTYTGTDVGRATRWAATSLLAKVYLTRASLEGAKQADDYAKAAQKAKEVIASGKFSLWPDYADAFKVANKNGRESIFEVQYKTTGGATLSNPMMELTFPRNNSLGRGLNQYQPTNDLLNSYEPGDQRRATGYWTSFLSGTTTVTLTDGARPFKYLDAAQLGPAANSANRTFTPENGIYVLRYADVLLMAAEALSETGGPSAEVYGYINQVRARARKGAPTGSSTLR